MAAKKSVIPIPPFPNDIDRMMFGAYMSGFVDGEGCFSLGFDHNRHSVNKTPLARFTISLRSDDIGILNLIHSYLQCGNIQSENVAVMGANLVGNRKPKSTFVITRVQDLFEIVVPHFEKFPLFAKKKRDFVVWKDGVKLAWIVHQRKRRRLDPGSRSVKKWTDPERDFFISLVDELRTVREFELPGVPA